MAETAREVTQGQRMTLCEGLFGQTPARGRKSDRLVSHKGGGTKAHTHTETRVFGVAN